MKNFFRKLFLIVISFTLFASCNENETAFTENAKALQQKRNQVIAITNLDLTSEAQYGALRDYFRTLADFALLLKTDNDVRKYWTKQIEGKKVLNFCATYLPTNSFLKNLERQCYVNGEYLCPEEVREFPAILETILKNSPVSLKDQLNKDPSCF